MNNEQILHCLEQVARFATMLEHADASRPRDTVIAQLAFNWGRFCELTAADGRANWRFLENALIEKDYDAIIAKANNLITLINQ